MENFVRYETKDERGETRRERNEKHDAATPEIVIPEAGKHIWEWYADLSQFFVRVKDSVCVPIPPSEFLAWRELTENIVHDYEFEMLAAIDRTYCRMMNSELQDYNIRERERHENEVKKRRR